jgi:hypothetical protein
MVTPNISKPGPNGVRTFTDGGMDSPGYMIFNIASFADTIVPWGNNPALRDQQLRQFYITEPWMASTVAALSARNAAFDWELDGPEETVAIAKEIFDRCDYGEGFGDLRLKVSTDLLTQDNGAFIEIIRERFDPSAPILGLAHLDAGRCQRTGRIDYPVVYTDLKGARHKMAWYQIISITDSPSPIENMKGMQECAVSRVLRYAQTTRDIAIMEHEKVSGRFAGALNVVSGINSAMIEDAMAVNSERADNKGQSRYILPAILATLDPTSDPKLITIPLKYLPETWDPEVATRWYIATLALAFGCDYQDLAPLPGGNLGSSQQSEVLHLKSGGKAPKLFMSLFEHHINTKVLPRTVIFNFVDADVQTEALMSDVMKRRAERFQIYVVAGIISPKIARLMLKDVNELKPEYIEMMAKEDLESQQLSVNRNAGGVSNSNPGGNIAGANNNTDVTQAKELTAEDWWGLQRQSLTDEYAEEMENVLTEIRDRVIGKIKHEVAQQ